MGKDLHENKAKRNSSIRVAAVLLCLTLCSTYLVTGLLARYSTSDQSIGNARVARFSIKGGGSLSLPVNADLIPGETGEVPLIIENNSEVAVEYTVAVSNETNNLPLTLRMEKKMGSGTEKIEAIPFTEQRLPGSHTDEYTLYIDWAAVDNDVERMGMVDYIAVTVTAVQTD